MDSEGGREKKEVVSFRFKFIDLDINKYDNAENSNWRRQELNPDLLRDNQAP